MCFTIVIPDTIRSWVYVTVTLSIWIVYNLKKNIYNFFSLIIILKSVDSNSQEILSLLTVLIPVFGLIFVACELNQRLTDKFGNFNDNLWEYNWYLFPIELKRMYLIFASNTQQPVNIRAYGNIFCTRETFKLVIYFINIIFEIDHLPNLFSLQIFISSVIRWWKTDFPTLWRFGILFENFTEKIALTFKSNKKRPISSKIKAYLVNTKYYFIWSKTMSNWYDCW